ncbi:MAG: pyridoxal phosphate-dependent aminotransferase [Peptococcaceae bacterium]|nr:pyridoxal phosphate-dependent aminotransferase [Peptococcaceae bacterium]
MRLSDRAKQISPSPTLTIDAKAKAMKSSGLDVIGFGAGEPDFDTPDHIKEAAIAAIHSGMTKYTPVAGTVELKAAICQRIKTDLGLDYQPNQIVVAAGAKYSLYNAMQVLLQPGDQVVLPAPYWVSYLEQIKLAGAEPVIAETREENDFKLTAAELEAVITDKTRMLVLNSPSNPTGIVYNEKELAALGEVVLNHQDLAILSDEIYDKLIYDGVPHVSIATLSPALKERTIIINGVSKTYSMTGWRIGYSASEAYIAEAMADMQSHSTSNPTSIAQAASLEALSGDQDSVQGMVDEYVKRREFAWSYLVNIPGITCRRPAGAFYLFPNVSSCFGKSYNGKTVNSATDLAALLLDEVNVAAVPGVAFGDDRYLRLSYALSMDTLKEGLDRIKSFIEKLA